MMLKKGIAWVYTCIIFTFLYAPIAVLMLMSFNESQYNSLPFQFSTRWYNELANNQTLIDSSLTSIYVAAITALFCVILATMLMLWIVQTKSPLKKWIDSLIILPLTIPWLILGLSILLLLNLLNWDKNFYILLVGHIIISLPYTVMVIKARLQSLDFSINEASASLGANEWTTFRKITFPLLFPAMLAGGFLAFVISFDNFILSYFLIPSGQSTLPIEIYSSIKFGFTPEINAVSTVLLAGTTIIIIFIVTVMKASLKFLFK
ncbi:ABC transporter permease [Neobacillus niacini]|uniref:ABC transporter permease n=1 Tax=Neobacillus niacini TaxID=86668 RepID=UPI001F1583AC|nr:ABC transporter permease [Neobacillus niacini]MEC1522809.1 ABC transporter permease [Neobacillus niacini]